MLKRLGMIVAAIGVFCFLSEVDAAKIKFKTNDKRAEQVAQQEESALPDVPDESAVNESEPLSDVEVELEAAEVETESLSVVDAENKTAESQSNASKGRRNDAETLTPIPSGVLPPMTDKERDEKYPVIPEALEMTLEELAPTKELRNIRVLKAMARIPRAEFVPKDYREFAYRDAAIPIGESQTISPPFIVAYMTETLDPQPTDRVLEIGTGSGYQAAVLSCLVSEVYTIEIVKSLGRKAAETLKKLRYDNVFVRVGDGYQGWPEAAPFDKIIVTCSPEDIPQPLIDQLKDGGKMIIPIGERYLQYFVLCEKKGTELVKTTLTPASFVPMTGQAESLRRELPDPNAPSLIGGGFETLNPTPGEITATNPQTSSGDSDASTREETTIKLPPRRPTPEGWFSTSNIYVAERDDAYEGARVCVCDNAAVKAEQMKKDRNEERIAAATLPENRTQLSSSAAAIRERQRSREAVCHLRQNFAINGSSVKRIIISGAYRVETLQPNVESRRSVTLIKLYFFDKDRKPVKNNGEIVVLTTSETACPWTEFSQEIAVPARATEASLQVGILDGVGIVEFDGLELRNKNEKTTRATKSSRAGR